MNTKQQSIKPFLEVFNAVHEDSGNNHAFDSSNGNTKKIDLSNYELTQLGYTDFVGMDGAPKALNLKQDKQGRYDSTQGQKIVMISCVIKKTRPIAMVFFTKKEIF